MKLIELHRPDGTLVWINPDTITALTSSDPTLDSPQANTKIWLNDLPFALRETPDEVLKLLGA
jgi:hypothetical protein